MKEPDRFLSPPVLGIINHELRTPLAAIKGFTSLLLRFDGQIDAAERSDLLHEIDRAGDHLTHVIERLLLLAELSVATPRVTTGHVDISRLTQDALRHVEQRVRVDQRTAPAFVFEPSLLALKDVAWFVEGDAHLLDLLVAELLENAAKFSSEGTITVTLQMRPAPTQRAETTTAWVLLSVQDTGVGIPANHLETIFAPFTAIDTTLTRPVAGMGIGLALCRHIATLFGGQIWAESAGIATGSVFHLMLPLL